jgi:hypothetical protein
MEKDFPTKWSIRKARIAIIIYGKADFKPKLIRRDKGHFIFIK